MRGYLKFADNPDAHPALSPRDGIFKFRFTDMHKACRAIRKAYPKPAEHFCEQCGKPMGAEWILGPVCGSCCRKNHRAVCGR